VGVTCFFRMCVPILMRCSARGARRTFSSRWRAGGEETFARGPDIAEVRHMIGLHVEASGTTRYRGVWRPIIELSSFFFSDVEGWKQWRWRPPAGRRIDSLKKIRRPLLWWYIVMKLWCSGRYVMVMPIDVSIMALLWDFSDPWFLPQVLRGKRGSFFRNPWGDADPDPDPVFILHI